jgi:hypothetical protein
MQVIGITTGMSAEEMQQLPVANIIEDYRSLAIHHITTLF